MFSDVRKRAKKAGQPPGTPLYTGAKKSNAPVITVVIYNDQSCYQKTSTSLASCFPTEPITGTTWINFEGLNDTDQINQLAKQYNLHPLTVEDILNVEQRPKVDEFEHYLFITVKALIWHSKKMKFTIKQVSLILGKDFVITFQELDTTLFDSIQKRLASTTNQRLREQSGDYLTYRLIDAIVDNYFVVFESISDLIEQLENQIITSPTPKSARKIYHLKRQMLFLRKAIWPMREVVSHLTQMEDTLITPFTRVYMRDLYDHTVQAIDSIETFREILSNMLDMYLSSITNRMNEIMKTLTIITTIFIPITAIASIYGMNFSEIPGLHWHYGYPVTIASMILVGVAMMIYFKWKKWF